MTAFQGGDFHLSQDVKVDRIPFPQKDEVSSISYRRIQVLTFTMQIVRRQSQISATIIDDCGLQHPEFPNRDPEDPRNCVRIGGDF